MGFQYNDTLYRLVRLRNIELSTQSHGTTFINEESIDYSVDSCPHIVLKSHAISDWCLL